MSTVGYCLLPLAIFGCLVSVLHNLLWLWVKLAITTTALSWSTIGTSPTIFSLHHCQLAACRHREEVAVGLPHLPVLRVPRVVFHSCLI